jgi:hypothetical protein
VVCVECVCAGVPSDQLKSKFCFVCIKRLNINVLIIRPKLTASSVINVKFHARICCSICTGGDTDKCLTLFYQR